MRLDLYLWASRITKTRSAAKELLERDAVRRLGATLKPSTDIRIGDRLEVHFDTHTLTIEVLALPDPHHPPSRRRGTLYEIIGDRPADFFDE